MDWTLFVELPPSALHKEDRGTRLLRLLKAPLPESGATVIQRLAETGWSISLALTPPLTDSMARAIEHLNSSGVPLIAWTVLSEGRGYWTNVGNVVPTVDAADEIQRWANGKGILLHRIGFDFEIPIQLMRAFFSKDTRSLVQEFLKYLKALREREWANAYFRNYLESGIKTEFYTFPKVLRPILGGGLRLLQEWRVVEMLYSSTLPQRLGRWLLQRRDPFTIPALGIVSGVEGETPGVNLSGGLPRHLTTDGLARDISSTLKRDPSLKEAYLFAFNGPSVLHMLSKALETATSI